MRVAETPRCAHGCGPLQWVDDSWYCPKCGDEWPPEVVAGEQATAKSAVLPGAGPEVCICRQHRELCRFARQHSWSLAYVDPETGRPLLSGPRLHCATCGGWCGLIEDEEWIEGAECELDRSPLSVDADGLAFCDTCRNIGREPPP